MTTTMTVEERRETRKKKKKKEKDVEEKDQSRFLSIDFNDGQNSIININRFFYLLLKFIDEFFIVDKSLKILIYR